MGSITDGEDSNDNVDSDREGWSQVPDGEKGMDKREGGGVFEDGRFALQSKRNFNDS